jgi:hypothetical protein
MFKISSLWAQINENNTNPLKKSSNQYEFKLKNDVMQNYPDMMAVCSIPLNDILNVIFYG